MTQTNMGCHYPRGVQEREFSNERTVKVRNTSLYDAKMQAGNGTLPTQPGRGRVSPANPSSRKHLLPVSSLPQWIYRFVHKAPGFLPPVPEGWGPSWQETPAAPLSPANASSRLLCPCQAHPAQAHRPRSCQPMGAGPIYTTPRQVGAGDPPTGPKDAAGSIQGLFWAG